MLNSYLEEEYKMNGLSVLNLELSSVCNKNCWCCGRRKLEKLHPDKCNWGFMPLSLVYSISQQVPKDIIIQFHCDGEPLMYPDLKQALNMFPDNIKCFNTNAKLLLTKAEDIIDLVDTLTISVIPNDPEADEQYEIVKAFLHIKKQRKPLVIFRLLGNVEKADRWYSLPGVVATRILHSPMGSFDYEKKTTVPEHGICLDLLTHLVINRHGEVFPCVRFNPMKYNMLGNIKDTLLEDMWNSPLRKKLIKQHLLGNRSCSQLCKNCDFWGIPRGN
jgi:radical SAM protein with 4Fe4S-binding SPASM domain